MAPAALTLAVDMVGAIVVSGLARGEIISLTLAPALLIAVLVLLGAQTPREWARRLTPSRQR